jgi:DnaJ-class molecular chaperone
MASKDYYQVLGVPRAASAESIKRAYRRLARETHPDLHPGDAAAEARFKEVNEAYEVLADPQRRRAYDLGGRSGAARAARSSPTRPRTYGPNYGTGSFSERFDQFFSRSGGGARPPRPQAGRDIERPLPVTLLQAYTGELRGALRDTCLACGGAGLVEGQRCAVCGGRGLVERPGRVEVRIPPGVRDGARLRMPGLGASGVNGGRRGDFFAVVTLEPHPQFERRDDDLYTDVPVALLDAILGGEALVPTLRGAQLAVRIPPLTANERLIRLAGQGMPRTHDPSRFGDLFARVKVVLPAQLSERERALFEALRAMETPLAPATP